MKKYFMIAAMVVAGVCRAQTQIHPLQGSGSRSQAGVHYKNVEDVFSKFAGIWKYEESNKLFVIELRKKEAIFDEDNNNYFDLIIGEYKYVNNGVEVVNTLSNLNLNLKPYENNIAGMLILDRDLPVEERRVQLYFNDPERDYLNRKIILKHIPATPGSPAKLQVQWTGETIYLPTDTSPTTTRVPQEEYILVKQP